MKSIGRRQTIAAKIENDFDGNKGADALFLSTRNPAKCGCDGQTASRCDDVVNHWIPRAGRRDNEHRADDDQHRVLTQNGELHQVSPKTDDARARRHLLHSSTCAYAFRDARPPACRAEKPIRRRTRSCDCTVAHRSYKRRQVADDERSQADRRRGRATCTGAIHSQRHQAASHRANCVSR